MTLGEQLKQVRQLKGLTQSQLSSKSGLSVDTISKIESGININPTVYVIKTLSSSLDNIRFDIYEDKQQSE